MNEYFKYWFWSLPLSKRRIIILSQARKDGCSQWEINCFNQAFDNAKYLDGDAPEKDECIEEDVVL